MNIKNISYINKSTGEVKTVTINELASMLGINRSTITRRLKSGKYEDDNCVISNVASETDSNVASEPNVAPKNQMLHPNVAYKELKDGETTYLIKDVPGWELSQEARINNLVFRGFITQAEADAMLSIQPKADNTPKILPQKPCILCGEPVFHTKTLNNKLQHICFSKCQPIPHHKERIAPDPEIIAMLTASLHP